MATIVTVSGDKTLHLISNAIIRQMEIPPGATDIRVALAVSHGGGGGQTFNPAVTPYETFRYCFTAGPDVRPGIIGEFIGTGHAVGANASFTFGGNDGFSNTYGTSSLSRLSNLTTHVPSSITTPTHIDNILTYSGSNARMWIIRLHKQDNTALRFELHRGGAIGLPISDTTMNNHATTLGLSIIIQRHEYTFDTEEARDAVFNSMNTLCFAWPWNQATGQIAAMAYRVI